MKQGFSLVELSIVLVILGLLTGGILAGQSLIRASELRSISTQYSGYLTAIQAFRDKYMAIPGDITSATKFWGAQDGADGIGTDCTTVVSTSVLTCNGNGDGMIGRYSTEYYEIFRFWQHLANAGLVEGNYTGVTDSGNIFDSTPGLNAPRSKLANTGFNTMVFNGSATVYVNNAVMVLKNLIFFGGERAGNVTAPVITPGEAWNLDTKMDDRISWSGRVLNYRSDSATTPNCTTATDETALYNLASTDKLCSIVFYPGI